MSAPLLGLSIRAFARRDGCDDKLVRRAIKSGHLQTLGDGSIDPSLVGSGWRKLNRRAADRGADTAPDADNVRTRMSAASPVSAGVSAPGAEARRRRRESPAEAAERIVLSAGSQLSLAEAEVLKENYLARLRQLEYDTKAGQVVLVRDVTEVVGTEYARVRTRLLAIPAEQAPRLAQLKTVPEIQDALLRMIVEALEELTRDGDGPAAAA